MRPDYLTKRVILTKEIELPARKEGKIRSRVWTTLCCKRRYFSAPFLAHGKCNNINKFTCQLNDGHLCNMAALFSPLVQQKYSDSMPKSINSIAARRINSVLNVEDYLAISFHKVDTFVNNLSNHPALQVSLLLQDLCVSDCSSPQSGNSFFPCLVFLYWKHCKSKWHNRRLLLEPPPSLTKAALAVGPNTNFRHTGCIKSYHTRIAEIQGFSINIHRYVAVLNLPEKHRAIKQL